MTEDLHIEGVILPPDTAIPPAPRGPRRGLWTLAAAGACLLIAGTLWMQPGHDALLCRNLLKEDGKRICDALLNAGVRYTLTEDGSAVYVPKEKLHKARLAVVKDLSSSREPLRFDLVDAHTATVSPGTADYNAVLQRELESTIRSIKGVESARVLIETPGNLGRLNGDRPLAVVLVYTAGQRKLTTEELQLIQHLVASSTDLLSPGDVTISESPESLAQFKSETL